MRGLGTAKTKRVWCTHCGKPSEVARRAMSVFCAHCHQRLLLEDLVIKSYQALKSYATCGEVVVEKNGRVIASIQSTSLTVKGAVKGKVEIRGPVEIASTGSLVGDVAAPSLVVRRGAQVTGYCEIRPLPNVDAPPSLNSDTEKRLSAPENGKRSGTNATLTVGGDAATGTKPVKAIKAIVTTRKRGRG